jgi:hemerythrin-like metal-binding protein
VEERVSETILATDWSDKFSVGNAVIDEDHQAFFEIAALLRDFDKERQGSHVIVESALNLLNEYVNGHFLREEKAMKKINFIGYDEHLARHVIFREKIKEIIIKYNGGVASASDYLHKFVIEWLTDHILKEDMKFKTLIGESDVDNRPMAYLADEAYKSQPVDIAIPIVSGANTGLKGGVNYSNTKTLIYEPSSTVKSAIRYALNGIGISNVEESKNLLSMRKECEENSYQLLIINNDMDTANSENFVREMRAFRSRCDPFIFMVLLQTSRDETLVRAALNSGADCVLLIPFSPGQLINQIKLRVERRKSFIVTHDYIGYERRFTPRPGQSAATHIPVPNPILASGGFAPPAEYEKASKKAIESIAIARINSLVNALDYETNALMKRISDDMASRESTLKSLIKIESVSEELSEKIKKYMSKSAHKVCALRRYCTELKEQPEKVTLAVSRVLFDDVRKFMPDYITIFDV